MNEKVKKQLRAFMKEANQKCCLTKSYGGDIITANSEEWSGTFYSAFPNGKLREVALIVWKEK
jgi:hypothetical protein